MEHRHLNHEPPPSRVLTIELVYDRECPHVALARAMIIAALDEIGAERQWTEWDRDDPASPPELRRYGSPTVLVNRKEAAGGMPISSDGSSCRLYVNDQGIVSGAPAAAQIVEAIRDAQSPTSNRFAQDRDGRTRNE